MNVNDSYISEMRREESREIRRTHIFARWCYWCFSVLYSKNKNNGGVPLQGFCSGHHRLRFITQGVTRDLSHHHHRLARDGPHNQVFAGCLDASPTLRAAPLPTPLLQPLSNVMPIAELHVIEPAIPSRPKRQLPHQCPSTASRRTPWFPSTQCQLLALLPFYHHGSHQPHSFPQQFLFTQSKSKTAKFSICRSR